MKSISFSLIILVLLTFSCTSDTVNSEEIITRGTAEKKLKKAQSLEETLTAENPSNIYDLAGKLHNEILDVYLNENYQYYRIPLISQQICAIVNANTEFSFLNLDDQPACLEKCQDIANDPQMKFDESIANSSLSNLAKVSFSDFMETLLFLEGANYETVHQFIVSYESGVMADAQFSDEDKRIILTTASITRYSLYYEGRRKDKDWESSVGNRAGAFMGAIDNLDSAVGRSLVIGIMANLPATN